MECIDRGYHRLAKDELAFATFNQLRRGSATACIIQLAKGVSSPSLTIELAKMEIVPTRRHHGPAEADRCSSSFAIPNVILVTAVNLPTITQRSKQR